MDHCIICDQIVRPRQEALLCDGCERWQHRTCQTGISQLDYREAVSSGEAINWHCEDCEGPPLNSTPVLFSDGDFQSMVRSVKLFSAHLLSYIKNDFVRNLTFFFYSQVTQSIHDAKNVLATASENFQPMGTVPER